MQTADFDAFRELEDTFWWFVGIREIQEALLDPLLRPSLGNDRDILDIGCGTGGNLTWLRRYSGGGTIFGLDIVPTALAYSADRGHERLTLASATDLPFADERFDLVTIFDVVQQLAGDGAADAFAELHRVLRPGGWAFVRSAAYEWMRSGHDTALGTQHRFTEPELAQTAVAAELDVVRSTYANTGLFPIAAVRRLLLKRVGAADRGSDVKALPSGLQWANRPFTKVLGAEARWLRRPARRLPFGLSTIVVVRKRGAA